MGYFKVKNCSMMFRGCTNLTHIPDISIWNTSKVDNCSMMFEGCISLDILPDLGKWDCSNIENIDNMFYNCVSLVSVPHIKFYKSKSMEPKDIFINCISLSHFPHNFTESYEENIIISNISNCLNLYIKISND